MFLWRDSAGTTQRRLWMCCVFVCLCVLSVDSSCKLIINPKKLYFSHGTDMNISCTSTCNLPAEDLQFSIGPKKLRTTSIDNTTIQLYVVKPEAGRKTYYCSSKTKKIPQIGIVHVERFPEVTDFKCIVNNFQSIDCTWSRPKDNTTMDYELTYTMNGAVSNNCDIKQDLLQMQCHLDNFTNPTFNPFLPYEFHLKVKNEVGINEQLFSCNYSIVKPKPVYNLIATNTSAHAVELNWQIDNVLKEYTYPHVGLMYRIEYETPTLNYTSKNVTMCTEKDNITYYLDKLPYAHTKYKLQILTKIADENNSYWSKPRELEIETAGEKPPRPPELPPGAFDHSNYQGMTRRFVYVYWKKLYEYEKSGANFTYHFDIKSSTNSTLHILTNSHLLENKAHLKFESKSEDSIDFRLWSKNIEGISDNSSNLHIPAYEDTVDLRVSSLTIHTYENGTRVLFWKNSNNVDNYTLFWCTQHIPKICKEGIEYETLHSRTKKYTLPNNINYQFALSANIGVKSSGMVWPKPECEISQYTIAMSDVKITLKYSHMNERTIKLSWDLDCIYDGYINGYNISYYFEDDVGMLRKYFIYISDPKQLSVYINELRPFTRYHFEINLDIAIGLKSQGHNISLVTLEDTPSTPTILKIYDITNTSLTIGVRRPLSLNGNISHIKYVIYSNGKEIRRVPAHEVDLNRYEQISLDNLDSFTNYSLSVKAYNEYINVYSDSTASLFVRTRIGRPSRPMHLRYKTGVVSWEPPENPGGYVDRYLIRITTDNDELIKEQYLNGTVLEYYATLCNSETKGSVNYEVSALNFVSDKYYGAFAFSDRVSLPVRDENETIVFTGDYSSNFVNCVEIDNLLQLLSFIFVGFICLLIIYGALKLYRKYKDMAEIDIPKLPLGLALSEQRKVVKTDMLIAIEAKNRNIEIVSGVKPCNEEESQDSLLNNRDVDEELCANDHTQQKRDESVNRLKDTIRSSIDNGYSQTSANPETDIDNTLQSNRTRKVGSLKPKPNGYASSVNLMTKYPRNLIKPETSAADATSGYVQAMLPISTNGNLSRGAIELRYPLDYIQHSVFDNISTYNDLDNDIYKQDKPPSLRMGNGDLSQPAPSSYVSSDNATKKYSAIKPTTAAEKASGYVQAIPSIPTNGILANREIKQPYTSDYVHHSVFNNTRTDFENRMGNVEFLKPSPNVYVPSDSVLNKFISILDSEHSSNIDDRPSKERKQNMIF